jgi:hypothetical protein
MAKNRPHEIEPDDLPDEKDAADLADTVVDRGRAILERFPTVAGGARNALSEAQDQVDELSDMGAVAAAGFALGLTGGLALAGAPRPILFLAMIPVALTLRSAMARGVRPDRLMN